MQGLSLEEQVKSIFLHLKLCPIYRLKELIVASTDSKGPVNTDQLLRIVRKCAVLVSSPFHWVVKSELVYPRPEDERLVKARNVLLLLLHQSEHVTRQSVIDDARVPVGQITEMLEPIARLHRGKGWSLKHVAQNHYLTDSDAMESLLNEQEKTLQDLYKEAQKYFKDSSSSSANTTTTTTKASKSSTSSSKRRSSTSNAAMEVDQNLKQEQLPNNQVLDLLRQHSVCDMDFLTGTLGKSAAEITSILVSLTAACLVTALPVSRSWAANEIGDSSIDPYRAPVLLAFQKKSTLKKGEVMEAIRNSTSDKTTNANNNTDDNSTGDSAVITPAVYAKLMKSLAVSKGSLWMIRPSPSV